SQRTDRRGPGRGDHRVAALPQPHEPFRPRHTRVAGWTELANQAQLLQPRFELGARHSPLDPLRRRYRRFDGRPLPVAAEVRTQARSQIAGTADVEDLVVATEEAVDAGSAR